jgi:hypothetical protein
LSESNGIQSRIAPSDCYVTAACQEVNQITLSNTSLAKEGDFRTDARIQQDTRFRVRNLIHASILLAICKCNTTRSTQRS